MTELKDDTETVIEKSEQLVIESTQDFLKTLKEQFGDVDNPEKQVPKRYAVYIRKSTESEDKQMRSLGDQLQEIKEMMERLNIPFRSKDVFSEAKSAKESGIRAEYRKMMDLVIEGKYDGIISWHPNRLARNMKDGGGVIDLLDKDIIKDLQFVSFTYTNDTSGKMLLGMTFVLSKQYSDHLSETVVRGIKRSIEDGKYINKAKHGYIKDKNGFLRPDGKNHELIVEVFKRRLEGVTTPELAEYLNKNDYTRRNSKTGKVYSQGMTKQKLQKILRDPIYTGVSVYGKRPIDLTEIYNFVPVISVADFLKLNKLDPKSDWYVLTRSYKRGDKVKVNLLRQKVFCHKCGEAKTGGLTSKVLKAGKTHYYYFRCDTDDCPEKDKSTRASVIQKFVQDYIKRRPFSNPEAYKSYKEELRIQLKLKTDDLTSKLAQKRSELTKAKQRIKEVKETMAVETDKVYKDIQKEDLVANETKIQRLDTEIGELDTKLKDIKGAEMTYSSFLELFDYMAKTIDKKQSMEELDAKIQKVFLNFTVSRKKVEEYTLCEPFIHLERLETMKVSNGAR